MAQAGRASNGEHSRARTRGAQASPPGCRCGSRLHHRARRLSARATSGSRPGRTGCQDGAGAPGRPDRLVAGLVRRSTPADLQRAQPDRDVGVDAATDRRARRGRRGCCDVAAAPLLDATDGRDERLPDHGYGEPRRRTDHLRCRPRDRALVPRRHGAEAVAVAGLGDRFSCGAHLPGQPACWLVSRDGDGDAAPGKAGTGGPLHRGCRARRGEPRGHWRALPRRGVDAVRPHHRVAGAGLRCVRRGVLS